MKKICISIPCFNEERNINLIYQEVLKVTKKIKNIKFYFHFIDDCSSDNTWSRIKQIVKKNSNVSAHKFIVNHGKETALFSAINEVKDIDAMIFIDADLQHPPKIIPKLINEWLKGHKVVAGRRVKDKFSLFRNLGSKFFYYLLNRFSEIKMQPYSTDFRIIDKTVISFLKNYKEQISFMRGLIDLIGFKVKYIDFSSDERTFGNSKFSFRYLFSLATSSFINFSLFPLRIVGYLGLLISTISLLLLIFFVIYSSLISSDFNFITLLFLISFIFMGLILASLGLIALYIGNIHRETLGRPRYSIEEKI